MDKVAFIDVFTTENDLYGSNNCPVLFRCEIMPETDFLMGNVSGKKSVELKIVPDERILPNGTATHGFTQGEWEGNPDWKPLKESMSYVFNLLSGLSERKIPVVGYNHANYDLRILNETFSRLFRKKIDFPDDILLDVMKLCIISVPITEIGNHSTKSVMEYFGIRNLDIDGNIGENVLATERILGKIMEREGIPSIEEAFAFVKKERDAEFFSFGKYKGRKISEAIDDPQYLSWCVKNRDIRSNYPNEVRAMKKLLSEGD